MNEKENEIDNFFNTLAIIVTGIGSFLGIFLIWFGIGAVFTKDFPIPVRKGWLIILFCIACWISSYKLIFGAGYPKSEG